MPQPFASESVYQQCGFSTVLTLWVHQNIPGLCCNGAEYQRKWHLSLFFFEIFAFCSKSKLEVITQSEEISIS